MIVLVQEVAALRQRTGAGMMDCKQALIEAGGDVEQAIDFLRKKGKKVFADRAVYNTNEGAVFACSNLCNKESFLLILSCETDFVAKNDSFLQLGKTILEIAALHRPGSIAELEALPLGTGTVQDALVALIGTIGEKITISIYETLRDEVTVSYIHTGNRLAVLVALQGAQGEKIVAVGRDIAMHIAAMNPIAVDKNQVSPEVLARESAVIQAQIMDEGYHGIKAEKITQGRLNKFFQENILLQQSFVKNNKLTVAQYLQTVDPSLTVTAFKRVSVSV